MLEAKFGITFRNDLTITSEGNTMLTIYIASGCIAPNVSSGDLTMNANLDLSLGSFYNSQHAATVIHTYVGENDSLSVRLMNSYQ